jgi:hypothetical protein
MYRLTTGRLLSLLALAGIHSALAQTLPDGMHRQPDPADASIAVPAVAYQSTFGGYRPLLEDKLLPWRDANDEVGRIGGWRAYAREGREHGGAIAAPASVTQPTAALVAPSPATATGQSGHANGGHGSMK